MTPDTTAGPPTRTRVRPPTPMGEVAYAAHVRSTIATDDPRAQRLGADLAVPIAIVLAVFVIGFWVFKRIAPRVAENL